MKEFTRKQLLIRGLIALLLALLLIGYTVKANSYPGQPWPENSCTEQVLEILKSYPDATVHWGMINEPGKPGHGQFHAQAQSKGGKWLTIDPWNRVTESDTPRYNIFPTLKMTGEFFKQIRT